MPGKVIPINKNTSVKSMLEDAMEMADEYKGAVLILINKVDETRRDYETLMVSIDIPELFMTLDIIKNNILNEGLLEEE